MGIDTPEEQRTEGMAPSEHAAQHEIVPPEPYAAQHTTVPAERQADAHEAVPPELPADDDHIVPPQPVVPEQQAPVSHVSEPGVELLSQPRLTTNSIPKDIGGTVDPSQIVVDEGLEDKF